MKKKVKTLSEEQKSQFYKLRVPADIRRLFDDYSPEWKIFMSNSYGNSLFLHSSHLNKCCFLKGEPNFVQSEYFHESKYFIEIMAIKDISKGEEIKLPSLLP